MTLFGWRLIFSFGGPANSPESLFTFSLRRIFRFKLSLILESSVAIVVRTNRTTKTPNYRSNVRKSTRRICEWKRQELNMHKTCQTKYQFRPKSRTFKLFQHQTHDKHRLSHLSQHALQLRRNHSQYRG